MNVYEGLNPEQAAAVSHNEGPLLVVAGAGTGKTQVITRRIARLVQVEKAKPSQILALTFTDKAAREMNDRLENLLGWDAAGVSVMTYNSFGGRLLHQYGSHIGRETGGGILSDDQKSMLLLQRIPKIKLEYYTPQSLNFAFAERISDYIASLQNAGVTPERYREWVEQLGASELHPAERAEQRDLAAMYETYEAMKRETATYDYADQVGAVVQLLRERPNLAERVRSAYAYVLVDEYQDTSPIQDEMLRQIVLPGGNIFAVGDDDQAIYGFRGSDIANIQRFSSHFGVEKPVVLVENYRSGQRILDAAYRLIGNNENRLESLLGINKRLISRVDEADVRFMAFGTAQTEQQQIAELIEQQITSGKKASEIAILARGKATLRSVAKQLRARQIPYAISAETSIFEQRELLSLWYLLQWIDNRADDEAIGHVMIGPIIGWEPKRWLELVQLSRRELVSCEEALRQMALSMPDAEAVILSLDSWREESGGLRVREIAYKLVSESLAGREDSLFDRLREEGADPIRLGRVMRVIQDLKRLFAHMDDFATASELSSGDSTLTSYFGVFPRPPVLKVEEAMGQTDGVQLLTVHASKGLEFDSVYIINVTQKSWSEQAERGLVVPDELDTRSSEDPIGEQRRIMYVAATRARSELVISAGVATAGGQKQTVSGFVGEMLGEYDAVAPAVAPIDTIETALADLASTYPLAEALAEKLFYEKDDGWVEISVSNLEAYAKSPHNFLMEKVLGITPMAGPQMAFGIAVHGAIQAYYEEVLAGESPGVSVVNARLDELWSDRGYRDATEANVAKARAMQALQRFVDRERLSERRILATERPIRFELEEFKLRLTGRIDALFEIDYATEIRDFKTGVRNDIEKLQDEAKKSLQLRTYALALQDQTKLPVRYVTLDHVMSDVEGTAELTPRILELHRKKLGELADRLRAHDFDPGIPSEYNTSRVYKYFGTGEV